MAHGSAIKYSLAGSGDDAGAKAEPSVSTTKDDTDDTISITSTPYASDDSQAEYSVEDILDQDDNMDGVTKYLVQWTGYPLEKCTWEPAENMGPDLLRDLWDKKRKKTDYQPFDRSLFYGALAQKEGRHLRRNLMRKKRGLPQTFPFLEEDDPAVVREATDTATAPKGEITNPGQDALLSTTEGGGANTASTELIDITRDSDDDVVAIEDLSSPAASKTKTKKKKKQDTSQAKGKEKTPPKMPSKRKSIAETATPRPTDKTPVATAASASPNGQSKLPEKRPSSGSAKRLSSAGSSAAPKTNNVVAHRLSEHNTPAALRNETNTAPKPPPAKLPGASGKAGTSAEKTDTHSGKTFSARKSSKGIQETGNAFNSGKKIRTRPNLITAMSDPTKPQQLFSSRRTLRIAELQERDKPDRIIDPSKLAAQLFPISKGPPSASSYSVSTVNRRLSLPGNTSSSNSPISIPQVPKRKKSVRFSDVGDDDGSVVTRIRLISPPISSVMPSDEDDMVMHQEPARDGLSMPNRVVKLIIGAQKDPLSVVLSVTAHEDSTQTMLDEILGKDTLHLDYSCLAATLLHQLEGIRNKILFSGNIMPDPSIQSSDERLDAVSERLRTMSAGLVFLDTASAIILYPMQCEDWSEGRFRFPTPVPGEASSPLRYVVFSTYFDAASLLRPPKSAAHDYEIPVELDEREYLMRMLSGLDRTSFTRLFPLGVKKGVQRSAFLAFPPSSSAFMQQLAFWFRAMDPSCTVLYSTTPGAWMAFYNKISTGSGDGVVIVHEQVTSALRRFPNLNSLLATEKGACRFWLFSQSILSPPLFDSIEPYEYSESDRIGKVDVGRITWTQLFPSGLAIFITPSFILSEPQRTQDLLRWVLKAHQAGNILVTLVTAWDICGYLRRFAEEKMRLHVEIRENKKGPENRSERKWETIQTGATIPMCDTRYDIYLLASEICGTRETAYFRPIEYADRAINGDDEQSLVNWFGWWASLHVDQYRLFHVVGSDMELKTKPPGFAACNIQVPSFTPDTVADPDVTWERMRNALDHKQQIGSASIAQTNASSTAHHALTPPAPQSQIFPDAVPADFTAHLMSYSRPDSFWRIYGFAVYWKNADESFKYGTLLPAHYSIESWFNFARPFDFFKLRTYIGFFNMVGDSCGEVPVKQNDKPSRHPFVVIYRPQNPHRRQFEKTELIIWDPRAKSKFRGQDMLYQDDLTSAQRAVVDFVKKHGFEKHKLHLGRVLIGGEPFKAGRRTPMLLERLPPGFPQDHMSPNGSELDAAIEFVDALASDITNALPAGDPYVEARGFKKVGMNQKKPVDQSAFVEQHGPEELNIKGSSSERAQKRLDCDANIVFHAPRSEHKRHIGWSKCSNHFYEAARQARTQNPQQSMMKFEFRPTMEWYRDQIEEGRGYEHLHVDSWKEFFRTFGVGKQ